MSMMKQTSTACSLVRSYIYLVLATANMFRLGRRPCIQPNIGVWSKFANRCIAHIMQKAAADQSRYVGSAVPELNAAAA